MSERGRVTVRNPAEAVAIAKCWLAGWTKEARMTGLPKAETFHPRTCEWCDFPRDVLIKTLEEFVDWSKITADEAELRLEVEQFLALPEDEQSRLVNKAQGYEGPEPPKEKVNAWWSPD